MSLRRVRRKRKIIAMPIVAGEASYIEIAAAFRAAKCCCPRLCIPSHLVMNDQGGHHICHQMLHFGDDRGLVLTIGVLCETVAVERGSPVDRASREHQCTR